LVEKKVGIKAFFVELGTTMKGERELQYLHRNVDNTMAYYKMPGHLVKKVRATNRDHVSLIARKNP